MKYFHDLKTRNRKLPVDLMVLSWFSLAMFVPLVLVTVFARKTVFENIIPYTGTSSVYLYMSMVSILMRARNAPALPNPSPTADFKTVRYKALLVLGISLALGIYIWCETGPEWYHSANPYLRYDPLQTVFGIFLPLLWMLIISWPLLKGFWKPRLKPLV